ncbi:MAG TPA: DHA2 family efflux MFS transporter permease subunit [Methylomirabilota bacterium]|nr:DHA2 family efflux MFS transporter permease subunit [Methylomirabilota bacterium]
MTAEPATERDVTGAPLSFFRKWSITVTVMLITVMQILDTSVANVALPHIQGALSAGVEETAWILTSYIAANAVIIPATGWLTALLGRKRFFLICTVLFTGSSFLSGLAPNLELLVLARVVQGLGGGPVVPMAQALMWEIFPLRQRGTAMAVWGIGVMMGPILGPTLGGWVADNWSWRWIFYINLPIGVLGFLMGTVFLFDNPHVRRPGRVDIPGIALMIVGFGCLQLMLDWGEREDWFDSELILGLGVAAIAALTAFVIRELTAAEPVLDLTVFASRNFALGSVVIACSVFAFLSSMLLLALFTQKLLGYDAWTSGLVLAPGGFGNMLSLLIAGRLVAHVDQRMLLAVGASINIVSLIWMANLSLDMGYWDMAWPRFFQGFGMGFIFVPLQTLALSTVRLDRLSNATAAFNVVRNIGGSIGIALVTTLLARRAQYHQAILVEGVDMQNLAMTSRIGELTAHFARQGSDGTTAARQALGTVYREVVAQAQLKAFIDDFWLLAMLFVGVMLMLPLMRRVTIEQTERARAVPAGRVEGLPAASE